MLAPNARELLLDALRPDPDFVLDYAVGTTYSLDLDALLTAPLAFALFDVDSGEAGADPIAILAALRSYADRIAMYCDAAGIHAPPKEQRLFQLLEASVHPISVPNGVFHAKVWVLRYRATSDTELRHRALVLSRNLTFDRSWDTILRLDEDLEGTSPNAQPLATFLSDLQTRAPSGPGAELLRTLPTVTFAAPDGFASIRFWPLPAAVNPFDGIAATSSLVISPFATSSRLATLAQQGGRSALVTRAETLDRLGSRALEPWDQVFILHGEAVDEQDDSRLSGLHAKTYVFDDGRERRIFTGSANATGAAFERNVEMLVELRSRRRETRVSELLAEDDRQITLRRLLVPARPSAAEPLPKSPEEIEEERLDDAISALAQRRPMARARVGDDGRWGVEVELAIDSASLANHDRLRARLITSSQPFTAMVMNQTSAIVELVAGGASQVSSFVAFELAGDPALAVTPRKFVLVARLEGAPADRSNRLMLELLSDTQKVMRLLFLLLADGRPGHEAAEGARRLLGGISTGGGDAGELQLPLFENLVRTFSREPFRLHAFRRVVEHLCETAEGRDRLPAGFFEIWSIFDRALPPERVP